MSEENTITLHIVNKHGNREFYDYNLENPEDIQEIMGYISQNEVYTVDLITDGEGRGAENIEPIAKIFLYFSTLENSIEYIEKLKDGLLKGQSKGDPSFLTKVNDKLKEISKQNGIKNDSLDIINNTPGEISRKLNRIENQKIDSILKETPGDLSLSKIEDKNVIGGDDKIKVHFNLNSDNSKCSTEEFDLSSPEGRQKLVSLVGKTQKNKGFIVNSEDRDYDEKNAESIAKAFLYSATMKEEDGKEYIKKLKATIIANHGNGEGRVFLKLVGSKLRKILEQKGIKDFDLDIVRNYPKEIFEKLNKVREKTRDLKNKDVDLNKVKSFLLDGNFEKGFKEFKEGKDSIDAKLMRGYLEELKKNESPKFSKEEIKIMENFNPINTLRKSDFTDKYSDLLDEQAKKDLGLQEYKKVYSGEEKDDLVDDGYMQTLNSRTDSNQISYSEFVETEACKNAISSIFDKAIEEGITLEESAEKVEEELKIENNRNEKFEKNIESKIKENKALSNEEKEYLNKQKEFLEKRNKTIEEYVKNYGLKEGMTEQEANSEEWRRINKRINSAITINQERIEDLEKISKNQTIEKRKTEDRKSKLEKNSEHLQTIRNETIEDTRIRCINERKALASLMKEKKELNEEEKKDIANKLNSRKTVVGAYKYCVMPFLEGIKEVDPMKNPIIDLFRGIRDKKTIDKWRKKEELKEFIGKIPKENLEKLTEILSINGVKEKFNKISEKSGIKLGNFIDDRVREVNQSLSQDQFKIRS